MSPKLSTETQLFVYVLTVYSKRVVSNSVGPSVIDYKHTIDNSTELRRAKTFLALR
jgi:hypothetical protein